jgi:hypothetical protein
MNHNWRSLAYTTAGVRHLPSKLYLTRITGKLDEKTLIASKWESFALVPCEDNEFPDDFFLFTAVSPTFSKCLACCTDMKKSDNDFISTQGIALGIPLNAGLDNDNQFMVFRVMYLVLGVGHSIFVQECRRRPK